MTVKPPSSGGGYKIANLTDLQPVNIYWGDGSLYVILSRFMKETESRLK